MRQESIEDKRARQAAKRVGLLAKKNGRGFQLLNPYTNSIVAGERFNLTAQALIEYCKQLEAEQNFCR